LEFGPVIESDQARLGRRSGIHDIDWDDTPVASFVYGFKWGRNAALEASLLDDTRTSFTLVENFNDSDPYDRILSAEFVGFRLRFLSDNDALFVGDIAPMLRVLTSDDSCARDGVAMALSFLSHFKRKKLLEDTIISADSDVGAVAKSILEVGLSTFRDPVTEEINMWPWY
jgi:hypothetical protein